MFKNPINHPVFCKGELALLLTFDFLVADIDEDTIIIIGGCSGSRLDDVEVISLGDILACSHIADLPIPNHDIIAVIDSHGRPLACGGRHSDPDECLVYKADINLWTHGPTMKFSRSYGPNSIRLSDGRYWISGDKYSPGYSVFKSIASDLISQA